MSGYSKELNLQIISQDKSIAHCSILANEWMSATRLANVPPFPLLIFAGSRKLKDSSLFGECGGLHLPTDKISPFRHFSATMCVNLHFSLGLAVLRILTPQYVKE